MSKTPPDTGNVARDVMNAFGGLTPMVRALGHRNVSTVHHWVQSGRIPHWRWTEIEAAAVTVGVMLPESFSGARALEPRQVA